MKWREPFAAVRMKLSLPDDLIVIFFLLGIVIVPVKSISAAMLILVSPDALFTAFCSCAKVLTDTSAADTTSEKTVKTTQSANKIEMLIFMIFIIYAASSQFLLCLF
jgi:hypothetical protein